VMRRAAWLVLWIGAAVAIGWSALALYYASRATPEWARLALAPVPTVVALVAAWRFSTLPALFVSALLFAGVLGWYLSIQPSNGRDWQADVAKLPYATFAGSKVTVHNIRDFEYRSEFDYTPRYYDRTVNLNDIRTVDIVSVYWAGELIAHLFLSFGFEGGEQIAISIETRKEKSESYSTLAGFFRQYELIYVVGSERDLIGLRTNYREPREDAYVYRTRATPLAARRLFLDYMKSINDLLEHPQFYNTLTTNCTTVLAMHTQANPRPIPMSWKVLAPGLLAEYAYELGYLDDSIPFRELKRRAHVNARANAAGTADDFSAQIRAGLPVPKP
jgi:hypothetical protein